MILYAVGSLPKKTGWGLEGLFLTEKEAIKHVLKEDHFIIPVPVGKLLPPKVENYTGRYIWWPKLETKKEAIEKLKRIRNRRKPCLTRKGN